MSQTCPKCGTPNSANHSFCSNCGADLRLPGASAATSQSEAPASLSPSTDNITGAGVPTNSVVPGDSSKPLTYAVQSWDAHKEPSSTPILGGVTPVEQPYIPFVPPAAGVSSSTPAGGSIPVPPVPSYPTYEAYSPVLRSGPSANAASNTTVSTAQSSRPSTGVYAPYEARAVKGLDNLAPARRSLIPVIVVAALVLAALASLSAYLIYKGSNAPVPAATTGSVSTGGTPEEQVRAVVAASNRDQIAAWHQVDTEVLKNSYTGDALSSNVQMVNDFKSKDMFAIPVNNKLAILDVTVNGDTATVHTSEVWTVSYYQQSSGKKLSNEGPIALAETYQMVKQNGKWYVSHMDVVSTNGTVTPPQN